MKALAGLALAAAIFGSSLVAMRGWEQRHPVEEFMSLPPTKHLQAIATGFENVSADLLYLQFISYFGKHIGRDRSYHNIAPTLDVITELDPKFDGAYEMGALALGDAKDFKALEDLMAKWVRIFPNDWKHWFDAGLTLFIFAETSDEYTKAADYFKHSAALPGAAPKAAFMQARAYYVTGRQDLVKAIWLDTYQHSPSVEGRTVARNSLRALGVSVE